MAERLAPQIPDLEVRASSLAHHVGSVDREPYSILSLFARCIKDNRQHTAGGNPAMD